MMTLDSEKRPSASQALSDPWVKGQLAQDTHLQRTQERIREFNAKRKFKVSIFLACSLFIMLALSYPRDFSLLF